MILASAILLQYTRVTDDDDDKLTDNILSQQRNLQFNYDVPLKRKN